MYDETPPLVALPSDLSDEAAAKLLQFLHELTRTLAHYYAAQLHRHDPPVDERQGDFWDDSDPPF